MAMITITVTTVQQLRPRSHTVSQAYTGNTSFNYNAISVSTRQFRPNNDVIIALWAYQLGHFPNESSL